MGEHEAKSSLGDEAEAEVEAEVEAEAEQQLIDASQCKNTKDTVIYIIVCHWYYMLGIV